jgi:hypothetical protein
MHVEHHWSYCAHAIAHWLVSCGEYVLDAWRCPHSRRELGSPISLTVAVTAKQPTQLSRKVLVQMLASMLRSGTLSAHLVDLLMAVNRCKWRSEEAGRGPTRSTCMWENLRGGTGMVWSGVTGCFWTFRSWHCWHSWNMAATSLHTPFQSKRADTILFYIIFLFVQGGSPTPHPFSSQPRFVCKFSRQRSNEVFLRPWPPGLQYWISLTSLMHIVAPCVL